MSMSPMVSGRALRCPVCSAQAGFETSHPLADLYRCQSCDHCFADSCSLRRRTDYVDGYYDEAHKNWFENPNTRLFARILREIERLGPQAAVCDVGCGRGDFLAYVRERAPGMVLRGIDLCESRSAPGIEFIQGDIFQVTVPRTHDAVVSLATIEHVADPHALLDRLVDVVRPGGLIVVMTLNDRSVLYSISRVLARLGMRASFVRLYDPHHLNHFNRTSLRRLFEGRGLAIEQEFLHDIPLAAVDLPAEVRVPRRLALAAVGTVFLAGRLTRRTYLQTLIARKP